MRMYLLIIPAACMLIAANGRTARSGSGKEAVKPGPHRAVRAASGRNDLLGTWVGVKSEYNGIQPDNLDDVRSSYAVFEKDRVVVTAKGEHTPPFPYWVNQNVKPYQIDADVTDDKGVLHKVKGIYRVQGNMLWICVAENTRPTTFATYAGSKSFLAICKRRGR